MGRDRSSCARSRAGTATSAWTLTPWLSGAALGPARARRVDDAEQRQICTVDVALAGAIERSAMDACVWLLERGVAASAITWVKPREAWWLNRKYQQPWTLRFELCRGASIQIQAMAEATSVADLCARLEREGK